MTGVGLRRPSRVTGGHELHPGIVSIPGSQSTLAALPDPLDTRSPARETKPQGLPGTLPNCFAGSDLLTAHFSGVSFRPTSRCFERGLFFNGGRVVRAPIPTLALRHEPGIQALREVSQRHPCVGALHPLRMEIAHGKVRAEDNSKISGT